MKRSATIVAMSLSAALAIGAVACGSKPPKTETGSTGGAEGPDGGGPGGSAWGGGAPDSNSSGLEEGPTSGPVSIPGSMPAEPEGFYFDLQNGGPGDLVFAVDKGWQPVLFAYTGKPPKAKSVLMFPMGCTGACDAATPEEVCPVCKVEEDHKKRKQQEKDETKREIAPPMGSVKVPWDGQVLVYEKTKAGKRKCKCWKKAPIPADTYTIKACGLRPSTEAGTPSAPQCAETSIALPVSPEQKSIVISFPDPATIKPGKKKK